MTKFRLNISPNIPAILLTLGLVVWFQEIWTIEWSSPYCGNPVDGPLSAVYGLPLPYIRWSGVFSMEYFWMPSAFVLNIGLLFAFTYPLVSRIVTAARTSVRSPVSGEPLAVYREPMFTRGLRARRLLVTMLTIIGAILVFSFSVWLGLQFYVEIYKIPVANIASENYESYTDFRPVRFGFKTLRYQCTPLK